MAEEEKCREESPLLQPLGVLRRGLAGEGWRPRLPNYLKDYRREAVADVVLSLMQISFGNIVYALEAKDEYSSQHSQRVAELSGRFAEVLGVSDTAVKRVRLAAGIHDIGKIGIPDAVLNYPGRLSDEAFAQMKRHPEIGAGIIQKTVDAAQNDRLELIPGVEVLRQEIEEVRLAVLHHHERWNGTGYPARLAGEDIPRLARIIALCDSTDAMMGDRVYRKAPGAQYCQSELERNAGVMYDPELTPIFLEHWEELVQGLYDAPPEAAPK